MTYRKYDRDNDIERIFYEDSYSKKRIGIGIHNRASRRGYIRGGIKTQSDFLSRKQKQALNGEVITMNKYEDINNVPKFDDLMNMPEASQEAIFKSVKAFHTNKEVTDYWGISTGRLYKYYKMFNLYESGQVTRNRKQSKKDKEKEQLDKLNRENLFKSMEEEIIALKNKIIKLEQDKKDINTGVNVNVNIIGSRTELEERLLSVSGFMVEGEKYKLRVSLEEVKEE